MVNTLRLVVHRLFIEAHRFGFMLQKHFHLVAVMFTFRSVGSPVSVDGFDDRALRRKTHQLNQAVAYEALHHPFFIRRAVNGGNGIGQARQRQHFFAAHHFLIRAQRYIQPSEVFQQITFGVTQGVEAFCGGQGFALINGFQVVFV